MKRIMGQRFWDRLIVLAVAGALAGCSLAQDERDELAERVYDRNWVVSQVLGTPAAPGVIATLLIEDDGKVSGNAGCNGFFGSAIIDKNAISFGNLGTTRMACPEPAMGQEDRMLAALDSTRGYRLDAQELVLLDADGNPVLRFSPGEDT